jgi:hypothetical protein
MPANKLFAGMARSYRSARKPKGTQFLFSSSCESGTKSILQCHHFNLCVLTLFDLLFNTQQGCNGFSGLGSAEIITLNFIASVCSQVHYLFIGFNTFCYDF